MIPNIEIVIEVTEEGFQRATTYVNNIVISRDELTKETLRKIVALIKADK